MLRDKSNPSQLHDSGRIADKYCLTDSLIKSTAKPDQIRECRRSVLDIWVLETRLKSGNVLTFFRGCPIMFLPWCTLIIRLFSQENLGLQSLGSQGSSSCSSHSTGRRRRTFVLPRLTVFCRFFVARSCYCRMPPKWLFLVCGLVFRITRRQRPQHTIRCAVAFPTFPTDDHMTNPVDSIRPHNLCFAKCFAQVPWKQFGVKNDADHDATLADFWFEKASRYFL